MRKTVMAAGILVLSTACATTSDIPPMAGAGACDAQPLQDLVGQTVTQAVGANAMRMSGAKTLRWIPPNSAVTMDYRQDRLNISYDENSVITDITCG